MTFDPSAYVWVETEGIRQLYADRAERDKLRLRVVALDAEAARLRAIEAAAEELCANVLDMGGYYEVRSSDVDTLQAALDAGGEGWGTSDVINDGMSDEQIAACPYCGGKCTMRWGVAYGFCEICIDSDCTYCSPGADSPAEAIAAHNAFCADVQRGREAAQENARLRAAMVQIAAFTDVLDYKRGWEAAEIAKAALDGTPADAGEVTK